MLLNYFKIAVRILTRNRLVSSINIFGLALALSGSLLITMFISDELSYDRYHEQADHIYRVTRNYVRNDGSPHMHLGHLAAPFGPLLKSDFPDVIESVRTTGPFSPSISIDDDGASRDLEFQNGYFAEASLFKVFSIEILSGNSTTPLEQPFTIMLSDEAALRHFGDEDVVGKHVSFYGQPIEVTGTYRAFPNQSHWHPDVLISFSTLYDENIYGAEKMKDSWENNSFFTYILVSDDFDPEKTAQLFPSFIDRHMPADGDGRRRSASTNLFLQPVTSIHLHSHLDSEAEPNGNINHVYAMGSIGFFLIIIACFNFINLSTARATQRAKEVGLRKVSGALRKQLIFQYISESTLITFFAMIVAIAMASACLSWLNDFTGKAISINDYLNLNTFILLAAFVVVVGALAGLYPAFVISAYKPALVLKGQGGSARDGGRIRKGLVVIQFSISIIMIIATLVTYQQLQFLSNTDLGYNKDQIVVLPLTEEADERYDAFYNEMTAHPAIVNAARSNRMPTVRLLETNNIETVDAPEPKKVVMKIVSVDQHFFDTYDIPVIRGRNFSKPIKRNDSFSGKLRNGFILNERACKLLGWSIDDAVGKELLNGGARASVTGVVKDFHFESLHEPIAPIVFITYTGFRQVSVRLSASAMQEGIGHIGKIWRQFVTHEPFKYEFLNERYGSLYKSETSQQELFVIFAVLAVFIASLGLFGLATFNAVQRSKEVSIRKVLGASVQSILQLLSKEIIVLVLIANIIAWPVAWYLMQKWLGEFAYRVEMDITTFIIAGLLTMVVTIITISTQTLRAALKNPAMMLRNE